MNSRKLKTILVVFGLIGVTCAAMGYTSFNWPIATASTNTATATTPKGDIVSLSANLTQDKIYTGGDGTVTMSLALSAKEMEPGGPDSARHVDMVFVLDRSGSMEGRKIGDARNAIANLISYLGPDDRFALVSYANGVQTHNGLVRVTDNVRSSLTAAVREVSAGGGTNLGAGLQRGIQLLRGRDRIGNVGKIVLISDGLANQGITDPGALGQMAAGATEDTLSITTVGVGNDFNEHLMTSLADHGGGTYHYLENPNAFATVFEKEFRKARAVVASALTIGIPLPAGVSLVDAAGYPIGVESGRAVFHPGDLLPGQKRELFLKFRVPTGERKTFAFNQIDLTYDHAGRRYGIGMTKPLHVACVGDPHAALASIDKKAWSQKVVQEDYSRLKEDVSLALKRGEEKKAMDKIENYYRSQSAVNAVVGSAEVSKNLEEDLEGLRETVKDTFAGAPSVVAQKQKRNAKALQYESYQKRRTIK